MAGLATSKGRGKSADRAKTLPTASGTLLSRSGRLSSSLTRWPRRKRGGPKRPERSVFVSPFGHDRFMPTGRKEARTRAVSGPKSKEETPKEGGQHRLLIDVALH